MIMRAMLVAVLALVSVGRGEVLDGEVERSLERACEFLARAQREDGAIVSGRAPECATTALGVMALLANGSTPQGGPHAVVVRQGVDYLLAKMPDDGYIGKVDGSRMYGQTLVMLALAEAYGVEPDAARRARIVSKLRVSVEVLLKAQEAVKEDEQYKGGWRYEPSSDDADLSLSGWSALALRACRNIGMPIPARSADRAVEFVMRCVRGDKSGFDYQPRNQPSLAMSCVGVLVLYLLENQERAELKPMIAALGEADPASQKYPYYTAYYYCQATHQAGGEVWKRGWPRVRGMLLKQQHADGGWPTSPTNEEPGRAYTTAMAALTLAVPRQLLPTYRR